MNLHEPVNPLYLKENEKLEHRAVITKIELREVNKKNYQTIQLNETIFHPKGGGQPSDEGTINGLKVAYIHKELADKNRMDQFEIYHCFEENQQLPFKVGDVVELKVNQTLRTLHSRLHTSGHLVAEAGALHFPGLQGYQGNHYPNNSYVKFKITDPSREYDSDEIKQKITSQVCSWVEHDMLVSDILHPTGKREIRITQDWAPCGGTHVKSLRDIQTIHIAAVSINKKEGIVTVKYELPP